MSGLATDKLSGWAHILLLGLCYILSAPALIGNMLFLTFGWDDVLVPMRVLWLGYEVLVVASLIFAQLDYDPGEHRIRGPILNLVILVGIPLLVFAGALANV